MSKTLISPFYKPASGPAILLPASAATPNVSISHSKLAALIDDVRTSLDQWDGNGTPLQHGDVVSMSLINGVEFAAAFLGVGAHR